MTRERALTIADDWVQAAREVPRLLEDIERYGITGDESYLALRSQIDVSALSRLDAIRFQFSCNGDHASAILEHFRGSPPEVLAVPIAQLRLGTRARKRIEKLEIRTIGDVVALGTAKISSIEGAGKKMLAEICTSFRGLTERFLTSRFIVSPPTRLSHEIRRWLQSLDDRSRKVMDARLGLSGQPQTLETLGTQLELTRERVRQIEAKSIRREIEAEAWPQILEGKVRRLLEEAREPLWLVSLPFYDPFFDDFGYGEQALARVLDAFCPAAAHCFSVDGGLLLSQLMESEWQDLRSAVLDMARDCAKRRSTYTEFLVAVESLCLSRNARELAALLLSTAKPYVHTARPPGSVEPLLVAFGRGVDHVVRAVMEEADHPIHYSEIHRRVSLRSGADIEVRRVHATLDGDGYYLFARGTYGLWRHLEVAEPAVSDIIQAAEEVVDRADRQWHAGEILAALRAEKPELVGDLDFYRISAILTRSEGLRYLGRMVWVGASSGEKDSSDRIDIAQACARFLREAGRPLSRAEILERLKDWRGIGKYFQVHLNEEIFPVAPGVFGIRSRDLPVSMEQIGQMLDCVCLVLGERGSGLHSTELPAVFEAHGLGFALKVSQSTFFAFAARDARLQADAADYIGLSEWEGTRRFSVLAAGRLLAERGLSPISADDFRNQMCSLVGRQLTRADATFALRDNGYTYDPHSKLWVLPLEEQLIGSAG